jgi:hypothetical protein
MARNDNTRGRKPTREDLTRAAEAAVKAAEAAGAAAEVVAAGIEGMDQPSASQTPVVARTATGGGRRGPALPPGAPMAFEAFMAALDSAIKKAGPAIHVSENAGWVKIEGPTQQRIYITKTKTLVNRVETTLAPELIEGAEAVPVGSNGKIASRLPADPEIVSEAIRLLVTAGPLRPRLAPGQAQGSGR